MKVRKLKGIGASSFGPRISHLLFADDTLIFGEVTETKASHMQWAISVYETISGQQINTEKSGIVFGPKTQQHIRRNICGKLKIPETANHGNYLGLLSEIGRSKNETFQSIREKVRSRVDGWTEKNLSKAEKELLIKSVVQAIPCYAMSCFELPNQVLENIEIMIRSFWWGDTDAKRKIHWVAWQELVRAKANGGLGFRDFQANNLALLGKQAWRFLTQPNSLIARVFKEKYFPSCSIFEAASEGDFSWTWRSILKGLDVVKLGARKQINAGTNTSICHDPWLPNDDGFHIRNPDRVPQNLINVADLMDDDTRWWNAGLISLVFHADEAEKILAIRLGNQDAPDHWRWHHSANGKFTVKSAYHMIIENFSILNLASTSTDKAFWNRFWKFRVPQRAKHFAWRLLTDSLPTTANLRARTMNVSITCPLCQDENGTTMHLFFECSYSKRLWQVAGLMQAVEDAKKTRGDAGFRKMLSTNSTHTAEIMLMLCDSLWFQRNQRIFTDRKLEAEYLATSVSRSLQIFHSSNGWPERTNELLLESSMLRPIPSGPKIYFDAGIADGRDGIAAVAVDTNGVFVKAVTDVSLGVTDTLYAEEPALHAAMHLALELDLPGAQVVGDCLSLIRMVRDEDDTPPNLAPLLAEVKLLLADGHLDMPCWTSRDQNKLADSVTSHAKLNLSGRTTWDASSAFLLSSDAGRFQ